MASIILPEGIQFLNGLEANRASIIPDVGEPVWATDTKKLYVGDGAIAGGILVGREDDVVYIDWPAHGQSVGATGITSVISDGAALTLAQATPAQRPSFHIVATPDANTLGIITSGVANLANTSLDAGKAYFLDDAAPNTLVEAASEPQYSVRVCEVLRKVGTAAWVKFSDSRAFDRANASAGGVTITNIVGVRLMINTNHGTTYTQLNEIEFRPTAGVSHSHAADTAFASSVWTTSGDYPASRAFDGLNPGGGSAGWASQDNLALPQYIGVLLAAPLTAIAQVMYVNNVATTTRLPNLFDLEISGDTTTGHDGTWQVVQSFIGAQTTATQLFTVT